MPGSQVVEPVDHAMRQRKGMRAGEMLAFLKTPGSEFGF